MILKSRNSFPNSKFEQFQKCAKVSELMIGEKNSVVCIVKMAPWPFALLSCLILTASENKYISFDFHLNEMIFKSWNSPPYSKLDQF